MAVHVKDGTRDKCRHCGEWVMYKSYDMPDTNYKGEATTYRKTQWVHYEGRPESFEWRDGMYHCQESALKAKNGEGYERTSWRDKAEPKSFCVEHTEGGGYMRSNICHRPVKDEDIFMCGIHAKPVRARMKEDERRAAAYAESAYIAAEVEKKVARIKDEFGLEVTKRGLSFVSCDPDDLLEALERASGKVQEAPARDEEE